MKYNLFVAALIAAVAAANKPEETGKTEDKGKPNDDPDANDMTKNCKGVYQKFANASMDAKGLISKVAVKSFPYPGEAKTSDVLDDKENKIKVTMEHTTYCCNPTVCSLREKIMMTNDSEDGWVDGQSYQMLQDLKAKDAETGLTVGQSIVKAADGETQEEFADVVESNTIEGTMEDNAKAMANLNKITEKGRKKNAFAARPVSTTWEGKTVTYETVRLLRDAELAPPAARLLTAAADNEFNVDTDLTSTYAYNVVDADGKVVVYGVSDAISLKVNSGAATLTAALSLAALTMAAF